MQPSIALTLVQYLFVILASFSDSIPPDGTTPKPGEGSSTVPGIATTLFPPGLTSTLGPGGGPQSTPPQGNPPGGGKLLISVLIS